MATGRGRAATAMAAALMNTENPALSAFHVAVTDLNCPEGHLRVSFCRGVTFPRVLSGHPSSSYIEGITIYAISLATTAPTCPVAFTSGKVD